MNAVLTAARERRDKVQGKLDELLAKPTEETRELDDTESTKFEELITKRNKLDRQIDTLETEEKRVEKAAAAAVAPGDLVVRSEPTTYRRNSRNSYLRDIGVVAASAARLGGYESNVDECLERLQRNNREVDVETRKAAETEKREFEKHIAMSGGDYETRVNPNTTAGTGGEFVPPLWAMQLYAPYMRFTRVAANRCTNLPLPPGIDIINLPKITLGSLTGIQTANAAPVTSRDITTSTVSAAVRTIAGQEDISLQLLEQSPLAMDGIIFDDISRDYDLQLDVQLWTGTGANGQHQGVLTLSSQTSNTDITKANAVTVSSAVFFDASTSATQYRSIVNGVTAVETNRVAPPTAIWAHPRRVNSWAYAADGQNRPLYVAAKYGQYNTLGTAEGSPNEQGVAGELYGLPVVKDGNAPVTMNATATTGGTADPVVVLKEDDMLLWEGPLRLRALPEILSGTLQIRYQGYAYSAFMPNRFPPSISILTGNTGLAAPGF